MNKFLSQFADSLSAWDSRFSDEFPQDKSHVISENADAFYVVVREAWLILTQLIFKDSYSLQMASDTHLRLARLLHLIDSGKRIDSNDMQDESGNYIAGIKSDIPGVCALCGYKLKARVCPSSDTVKIVCQGCGEIYASYPIELDGGLRECPYCAGDALHVDYDDCSKEHWVWCEKCKASGPIRDSREEAISAWNMRGVHRPENFENAQSVLP